MDRAARNIWEIPALPRQRNDGLELTNKMAVGIGPTYKMVDV